MAQAIIANSRQVFLAADHTKFGRNALVRLGGLERGRRAVHRRRRRRRRCASGSRPPRCALHVADATRRPNCSAELSFRLRTKCRSDTNIQTGQAADQAARRGGRQLGEQVDLLIVGGGINGAGIARDAAGRGLSVLLVEKDDLASHTSRWSSKLIHGGLRYLEYYEFRLVREALIEREVLLRAAPHIVWPLTFVLPHSPEQRPAWLIRLGLLLYDHLGGRKILPGSTAVDLTRPGPLGAPLKPWVKRGFTYADCWVEDSRLVALNAMDAARARRRDPAPGPAASAPGATATAGWPTWCDGDGRRAQVRARALVNAAGPWVSSFLSERAGRELRQAGAAGQGLAHRRAPALSTGEHPYILQNDDKRIVFVIPFEGEFSLIGTTDVPYEGDPAAAAITPDETDYLCRVVNRYFKREIAPADVVWSYAGVRPLYDDASGNASAVTRDYVFDLDAGPGRAPLLSVFGGKITTYRKLAEHALEKLQPVMGFAARRLDRGRGPAGRRHAGGRLRGIPRRGPARATLAAGAAAAALGPRLRHAAAGHCWTAPAGSTISGRDLGGGLYEAEVDYLVEQGVGAHGRGHPLAPLAARPACRRRTRWPGCEACSTRARSAPRRRRSAA